tara:strand:+ start:1055 stop:1690 length:636 start_codon:yes stop_codon:yes gene_type:complete
MKRNYIIIYSFLILSLIILTVFFFYNYKSRTIKLEKNYNSVESKKPIKEKSSESSGDISKVENKILPESTLIENIEYISVDAVGNQFKITAKSGETNERNYNKIFLIDVNAHILLENSESILIAADFANYDKSTIETFFKDNVKINYLNHKVESEKLYLSFEDKLAKINDNVVYKNEDTKMYADNIEIDFKTKNTKISMNNNEKVLIKSTY